MRRDVPRRLFRGRELAAVSAQARAALGDDALVLRTSSHKANGVSLIEIVAASAHEVSRFQARLTPESSSPRQRGPALGARPAGRGDDGAGAPPLVLALVGPTGAGKTTTAVKLAVNPEALGQRKVGLVTLDTYRAGAVAQLETYARVAGLPMEVAYEPRDVAPALARLADRDVVIVDTPGRGPKAGDGEWRAMLAALAPDEVHLVMPATMRPDLAEAMRDALDGEATHLLLTKLDEVPNDTGVADLAARLDLPVRWVADGQTIPTDLAPGVPRLMQALGASAEAWS